MNLKKLLFWMPWPPPLWVLALAIVVVVVAAGMLAL